MNSFAGENPLIAFLLRSYEAAKGITQEELIDIITHAPQYYSVWWKNLLKESPQHVLIETSLVLFIIWLVFIRKTVDPRKAARPEKLSKKEVEWLIDTWKPEPLAPALNEKEVAVANSRLIIEKYKPDHTMVVRGVKEAVLNASAFDFLAIGRDKSIRPVVESALDKYGVGSCGPRGFYGTIDQHLALEQNIATFMGTQESICYSDGSSTISSAIPAFSKKEDLLLVDEACAEPILSGVNLSRSTVRYFRHNDMADLRRLMTAIVNEDIALRRDSTQQRRFVVVEGIYRNTGDICPLKELMKLREEFKYRIILDESMSFGVLGATGRGLTEHCGISPMEVDVVTFTLDTVLCSIGGICVGTHEIVDHQRLSGAGYCFSASSAPYLCAAANQALTILQERCQPLQSKLQQNIRRLRQEIGQIAGLKLVTKDETPLIHIAVDSSSSSTSSSSSSTSVDEPQSSTTNNKTPSKASSAGMTTRRRKSLSATAVAATASTLGDAAPEQSSSSNNSNNNEDSDWRQILALSAECLAHGVAITTNKFALLGKGQADLPPTLMLTVSSGYSDADIHKIVKVLSQAADKVCRGL